MRGPLVRRLEDDRAREAVLDERRCDRDVGGRDSREEECGGDGGEREPHSVQASRRNGDAA